MAYDRPTELLVNQERVPAKGKCPECSEEQLFSYPVLSEGGWFKVVKCRHCLASLKRESDPVGQITIFSATI
ncbi:hypothetical protein [Sinomonas humi]|uniref:Uncharacterized protein n=1 Tax=Sinomonas humi TaxID=1338436 RepID=A0A0B2AL27_9MICC|nr:hypothetical protein [Sinomonas humi]KHL02472.1 hypothetical protein LK10_12850 [Sinomonas humi]